MPCCLTEQAWVLLAFSLFFLDGGGFDDFPCAYTIGEFISYLSIHKTFILLKLVLRDCDYFGCVLPLPCCVYIGRVLNIFKCVCLANLRCL